MTSDTSSNPMVRCPLNCPSRQSAQAATDKHRRASTARTRSQYRGTVRSRDAQRPVQHGSWDTVASRRAQRGTPASDSRSVPALHKSRIREGQSEQSRVLGREAKSWSCVHTMWPPWIGLHSHSIAYSERVVVRPSAHLEWPSQTDQNDTSPCCTSSIASSSCAQAIVNTDGRAG
jgi:hypothetical protein